MLRMIFYIFPIVLIAILFLLIIKKALFSLKEIEEQVDKPVDVKPLNSKFKKVQQKKQKQEKKIPNRPVKAEKTVEVEQPVKVEKSVEIQTSVNVSYVNEENYLIIHTKNLDRLNLLITDLFGKRVFNGPLNSDRVDVTNLANGMYTASLYRDQNKLVHLTFTKS